METNKRIMKKIIDGGFPSINMIIFLNNLNGESNQIKKKPREKYQNIYRIKRMKNVDNNI